MYCNKCGEPMKNNSQVCPYCGATQPKQEHKPVEVDFDQFRSSSNQAVTAKQSDDDMPKSYYVDSWLLFGLCLIYGIIRAYAGLSNGDARNTYKGIVAICAAFVFIPALQVGVKKPVAILLVKILIAGAVVILI